MQALVAKYETDLKSEADSFETQVTGGKAENAEELERIKAGRRTSTPPDPSLKGAWFQTLTLEHQSWF